MPGLPHPNEVASQQIAARLADLMDLRLPAALLREQPYPDPAVVKQHLQDLLQRDAAVFLERYGTLLSTEELQTFEPLKSNYEVEFYLKHAQQQQQQLEGADQQQTSSPKQLSSTVKNRRLAFMRRLEQQGEFFSEHAMRQRQPLVWHECIGQHEGQAVPPVPAPAQAPGHCGFADSLLANYDEAMLRARLQQQLEDEEAAMSEHESESTSDGDTEHLEQQQVQHTVDALPHDQQRVEADDTTSTRPSGSLPPNASCTSTAHSTAADHDTVPGGAAQQPQQLPGQQQEAGTGRLQSMDMSAASKASRRQDFLVEMQHRFLEGLDQEHYDYASIDADTSLDDDWAREQAQDAEDAYFDAD